MCTNSLPPTALKEITNRLKFKTILYFPLISIPKYLPPCFRDFFFFPPRELNPSHGFEMTDFVGFTPQR